MRINVMECLYAWRWGGIMVLPFPMLWFLLRINVAQGLREGLEISWADHEVGIKHYGRKVEVIV